MRSATRAHVAAVALAVAFGWGLGALPAAAQDVGPGLWQDYRYPTSNPNWRGVYNANVQVWGWDPVDLRPPYWSSPDAVWNVYSPPASPSGFGPFWVQPYSYNPMWYPYLPRPVAWTGLQYYIPTTAPVGNTGYHAWYGPQTPGLPSYTPPEWVEWEADTPQGADYMLRTSLGLGARALVEAAVGAVEAVVALVPNRGMKQLYLVSKPTPKEKAWKTRELPVPPAPADLLVREAPEGRGFTQYYRVMEPGKLRWLAREAQIQVRERPAPKPAPAARLIHRAADIAPVVAPRPAGGRIHRAADIAPEAAPERTEFKQLYVKRTAGPGQGKWQTKTGRPMPNP